mmetsp:Transcript_13989/g.38774  ORF Transcript_13989/g.38774 Transcript_13989/m.38774 type:complete len:205 (-) Transcript_13989:449-1063(-)
MARAAPLARAAARAVPLAPASTPSSSSATSCASRPSPGAPTSSKSAAPSRCGASSGSTIRSASTGGALVRLAFPLLTLGCANWRRQGTSPTCTASAVQHSWCATCVWTGEWARSISSRACLTTRRMPTGGTGHTAFCSGRALQSHAPSTRWRSTPPPLSAWPGPPSTMPAWSTRCAGSRSSAGSRETWRGNRGSRRRSQCLASR